MAVAAFDSAVFLARHPEFGAIPVLRLQSFFDEAGLYLDNTDSSQVSDIVRRRTLKYADCAHRLIKWSAIGNWRGYACGHVNSATEGSVVSVLV